MMYCNNNIQCHDTRQNDNTMVQTELFKNDTFEAGLKQRNLNLSSMINVSRGFFKKKCVDRNALAQLLYTK